MIQDIWHYLHNIYLPKKYSQKTDNCDTKHNFKHELIYPKTKQEKKTTLKDVAKRN